MKILLAILFIVLPLVLSMLEERRRRERAREAMKRVGERQRTNGKPPPRVQREPAPDQRLADWIEQVRRETLGEEAREAGPWPRASDPLHDPTAYEDELEGQPEPVMAGVGPTDRAAEARHLEEAAIGSALAAELERRTEQQRPRGPESAPTARRAQRVVGVRSEGGGAGPSRAARLIADAGAGSSRRGLRAAILASEILGRPLSVRRHVR